MLSLLISSYEIWPQLISKGVFLTLSLWKQTYSCLYKIQSVSMSSGFMWLIYFCWLNSQYFSFDFHVVFNGSQHFLSSSKLTYCHAALFSASVLLIFQWSAGHWPSLSRSISIHSRSLPAHICWLSSVDPLVYILFYKRQNIHLTELQQKYYSIMNQSTLQQESIKFGEANILK